MASREHIIQLAIADLESGKFTSLRKVADAYGLCRQTITNRMEGRPERVAAHHHQQRLTPEQEVELVRWILESDKRTQPPSHRQVREFASRILLVNNDLRPLGKNWIYSFLSRHPRVASVTGKSIDILRAEAATPEAVETFLRTYEATRLTYNIRFENIYNVDETGIAIGICEGTQVIASAGKRKAYKKSPDNREWVTIVEAISATGEKVLPLVIFKGKHVQSTWFHAENVPQWRYTASEKGWTSNDIALRWLKHIFIPETKPSGSAYRMLILDGHCSHVTIDFMWEAYQNRIVLLYLPAHSSHFLQPLDIAVFGQLKLNYRFTINDWSLLDDAAPVKKERFVAAYHEARELSFTKKVIQAGWKGAGIHPLNIQKVQQSSQVVGRPITPPSNRKIQAVIDRSIVTPQSPQELLRVYRMLLKQEQIPKSMRIVISKASKAIGKANMNVVLLENTNRKLQMELQKHKKIGTRKRVQVDPNDQFSRVEQIYDAHLKAKAAAEKEAKSATKMAEAKQANDGLEPYERFITSFQI